jgi:hypothetical protein
MNWSGGFQYQPGSTWVVNMMYQATAGVGLQRTWNINGIPLSIALGGDRELQDKVFVAQQDYMIYPQFGTVNFLSNFNHNTWHSEPRTITGTSSEPSWSTNCRSEKVRSLTKVDS